MDYPFLQNIEIFVSDSETLILLDSTITQYIDIESQKTFINDASSIQEMSNYIESLKSDVESANEIIQSLLPLRISLAQSSLGIILESIFTRYS